MADDDDDPRLLGPAANYEHLVDPERARQRRLQADDRLHGAFNDFVDRMGHIDFAVQRARLGAGRAATPVGKPGGLGGEGVRGDPDEKAGIKTREEYMKEEAAKRERERRAEEAELQKDPAYRMQQEALRQEERANRDREAFAHEAEERARRLEKKRGQLAAGAGAPAPAPGGNRSAKKARLSFDEEEED